LTFGDGGYLHKKLSGRFDFSPYQPV
jgi:hypothetical protein